MNLYNPQSDFSEKKEEKIKADYLTSPLPRAVLRPNSYLLLDGEWRFAHDVEDKGLQERWYLGHDYEHTAQWPGSVEAHLIHAKGQQQSNTATWQDKVTVWYEREFTLPKNVDGTSNSMFQITFGACGYETRVWLNGHLLRTIEGEEVGSIASSSDNPNSVKEFTVPETGTHRYSVEVFGFYDNNGQEASFYGQGSGIIDVESGDVFEVQVQKDSNNNRLTFTLVEK